MKWTNIKDEKPKPNSEVIVFYLFEIHGVRDYAADFIHEKVINCLEAEELYWTYPSKEMKEKNTFTI